MALYGPYGVSIALVTGDTRCMPGISSAAWGGLDDRQMPPVQAWQMIEAGATMVLKHLKVVNDPVASYGA